MGWLWGSNYLVTHFDERICGGDVPSLRDVHDRGCQLFAFGSSCYSGRSSAGWYMLCQGFLDNGAIAYMGYWSTVAGYDAYLFAYWFYYYISRFYTVKESMELALLLIGRPNYYWKGSPTELGDPVLMWNVLLKDGAGKRIDVWVDAKTGSVVGGTLYR